MNVRLVAYRNATSSATVESSYELDLQEAPSVSLNYQFSDIKEPQTRKASYSQTFKLPFTDNNNDFFQNWFNVNLATLVFSTRQKFKATLFIGAMPQFEGFIQLKAVYQKAKLYEVVLMSNTADLFTVIGEQRLRDCLKLDNGNYSNELDHVYTQANIIASWNGGVDDFDNTSGTSLRDSSAGVQKVMYPMSITKPNFYYDPDDITTGGYNKYLAMDSDDINGIGTADASEYIVPINQFRPAIQLKTLLDLIIGKAGFSYTSTFIDSAYFGKLFMTLGGFLGEGGLPLTNSTAQPGGIMRVGNNGTWGEYEITNDVGDAIDPDTIMATVPANTVSGSDCITDPQNIWNESLNYFTKEFEGMSSVQVKHNLKLQNMDNYDQSQSILLKVWLQKFDTDTNTPVPDSVFPDSETSTTINTSTSTWDYENTLEHSLSLESMGIGESAQILMTLENIRAIGSGGAETITYGASANISCANLESKVLIEWIPFNEGAYSGTVNMPFCIDENIQQKDFLLDIIQRFNLLVISDPDNPSNLIIEPYNDYLAQSEIKSWTGKLDTSKEIIVKDTTAIQKKTIKLTDLEDNDLVNKELKESYPEVNVYGHYEGIENTNDFAVGELKNTPLFSPYINNKVWRNQDTQINTYLTNMAVQYEYTFRGVEGGFENPLTETNPKLFYYNGTATTVLNGSSETVTYNMHNQALSDGDIDVYDFTTYPVCTPFDITPSSNVYTLTSANKSLYWNTAPPIVGQLNVFNYSDETGSWFNNTLYGLYWREYLESIYNDCARIMEGYLYLNEVDIFNFKFNDEIFIKDSYWRILNISNYEVGGNTSTKVTLLKVVETDSSCSDCDYVVGTDSSGSNLFNGFLYYWCPDNDPSCTPDVSGLPYTGILAPVSCCDSVGGWSLTFVTLADGLFPCLLTDSPLPLRLKSLFNIRSILDQGQVKSILSGKIGGLDRPLVIGNDNTKFSQAILPYHGDDMVIKYKTKKKGTPHLRGEMHRIVVSGFTEGDTRGYAYPQGTNNTRQFFIPYNSNMLIRVNGIATVIGGDSSTYTVGTTEGFSYYTAFKNVNGTVTQLSTAGGQQEFSIREGANPTTCTLYITTSSGTLQFGLDDSQTDTKRIWSLTVDLSVQRLHNIAIPFGDNSAIWQNSQNIQFENLDLMIWN